MKLCRIKTVATPALLPFLFLVIIHFFSSAKLIGEDVLLSLNPDFLFSTANDYGPAGAPEFLNSFSNDFGTLGSPEFTDSVTNEYGIGQEIKITSYAEKETKVLLSSNPDLLMSTANDYGPAGAPESLYSINNDYGPNGAPESLHSTSNDYGRGIKLSVSKDLALPLFEPSDFFAR